MSLDSLVRLLLGKPTALPSSPEEWKALAAFAQLQGVGPLLAYELENTAPSGASEPAELVTARQALLIRSTKRALHLQSVLADLTRAFVDAGLPRPVALKGIHLAATVYPSPGLRPMYDLDVLVAVLAARRALDVAHSVGFTSRATSEPDAHHLPPLTRGSVLLEVHWLLVPPTLPGQPSSTGDMASILERAEPFDVHGCECLGLCPDDLLLHLCAHTAHHHLFEHRLRGVWDVALVLRHHAARLDWDVIAERAHRWGIHRSVAVTLAVINHLEIESIHDARIIRFAEDGVPADALDAAIGQLVRPRTRVGISPHVSRLWAPDLSLAEKIQHVANRALLLEFSEDPLQPTGAKRAWGGRLTRPFRVVPAYIRRWNSLTPTEKTDAAASAKRRNTLEGWLAQR